MSSGYQKDLFWMLTRTEFRMRDQGTMMGFLWSLLLPLLQFLILYAMFTHWMRSLVENYAAFLLIGIVQWNFFSAGTTHGLTSLRRKAALVANFSFPRVFTVLASVFSVLLSHLLEWLILFIVLAFLGVPPRAGWLLLPLVVLVELAMVTGAACLLSFLAVDFRDLEYVWGILLYALFFMTPVFYTSDVVGGVGRLLLAYNPMAVLIETTRALIMGSALPGPLPLGCLAGGAAALLAAGLLFFPIGSRNVVEKL